MRNDFETGYLEHHGILGQKHGERNGPPYPLGADDHSAREKKAGWMKSLAKAAKDHKRKKQRKKALKKAQEVRKQQLAEKKKEKAFEKDKEKILRSGDPKLIMQYRKQLTDNEINSALNRVKNEAALRQLMAEQEKDGFDKIDKVMKRVGQVTDWAGKGKNAYNIAAEVYNTFYAKNEKDQLPVIGKDNFFVSKDKQDKKDKKEKEKDQINKDWTVKYAKAQADWKLQGENKDREWREKMLKLGYKV